MVFRACVLAAVGLCSAVPLADVAGGDAESAPPTISVGVRNRLAVENRRLAGAIIVVPSVGAGTYAIAPFSADAAGCSDCQSGVAVFSFNGAQITKESETPTMGGRIGFPFGWFDLDGDGSNEFVVFRQTGARLGRLDIYALQDATLTLLAQSEIGGPAIEFKDIEGDGRIAIVYRRSSGLIPAALEFTRADGLRDRSEKHPALYRAALERLPRIPRTVADPEDLALAQTARELLCLASDHAGALELCNQIEVYLRAKAAEPGGEVFRDAVMPENLYWKARPLLGLERRDEAIQAIERAHQGAPRNPPIAELYKQLVTPQ